MLRGIQAFEVRWLDLRQQYPTNREENTLIAHAMGQLVDAYQPPAAILASLPEHLVPLFEELARAYFHGYRPLSVSTEEPLRDRESLVVGQPSVDGATRDITAAIARLKAIAEKLRCEPSDTSGCSAIHPSEAETLIVDFPERPE